MIGIIVTGHGHLATGLLSAVQIVAGRPEKFEAVDYLQEDTTDDLEMKLNQAIADLGTCEEGILIFSDLAADMITKVCTDLAGKRKDRNKMVVVTGVNLGSLVETSIARGYVSELMSLAELAVSTAKSQIAMF